MLCYNILLYIYIYREREREKERDPLAHQKRPARVREATNASSERNTHKEQDKQKEQKQH